MPTSVIDTHIHIWDLKRAKYEWLENDTSVLNRTYKIEELEQERLKAGITNGVLVQAANNIEDTALMLEVAHNTNWINGVVGWFPLTDPDATEKMINETYSKDKYFKGCRHLIHNEVNSNWLLQEPVIESLKIIAAHRLTYDIVGINTDHLVVAIKVAAKVPGLKIVLDHLNQPPVNSKQEFGRWGELMLEISQHKNVFAKISGLGTTVAKGKDWVKEQIKPYVLYAIDIFGTARCFCGGDWPVSLLSGSYQQTWAAYKDILKEELSDNEQNSILCVNAQKFYNL